MNPVRYSLFVLCFLLVDTCYSQQYSNITYDAGTSVEILAGADVCANEININGTFSGGGTICSGALPVSLSSFTFAIEARNVMLQWVTEWELNNSGFDIERRVIKENEIWRKISFIPGGGTTNERKTYYYTDEKLKSGKYEYRLKQLDYNGSSEYFSLTQEVVITPPKNFTLGQNYPNPGNPKSKINFEIPVSGRVIIKLYDITGREVLTLLDEKREADYYTVEFDGTGLASGVYFYRIHAEGNGQKFTASKKMILVK